MTRLWRSTISGQLYGELFQNVLHFEAEDDNLTPDAVNLEVRNQWVGQEINVGVKSWVPNSVHWSQVSSKVVHPFVGVEATLVFDQAGQQSPSTELIMQIATVLRFQTNIVGRAGRGRSYIPGVIPGFTTNGLIDDSFIAFAGAALTALRIRFIKDFNPTLQGPLSLCVAGRQNPGEYARVISIQPANKLGTQRRRNFT